MQEECRTRALKAEGRITKRKQGKKAKIIPDGEEEEACDDDCEMVLSDWESVASSKSAKKRSKGCSKGGNGKKKTRAPKASNEEKAEARKANGPEVAKVHKVLKALEPVVKECKGVLKSPQVTEDIKQELQAAAKMIKESNKKDATAASAAGKVMEARLKASGTLRMPSRTWAMKV